MLHRWTVQAADKLTMPGARPRASHFEERLIYDPGVACWLDSFLDHWLTLESARPSRKRDTSVELLRSTA
jgi:GMP synthase (glutamine-hydrolysing)